MRAQPPQQVGGGGGRANLALVDVDLKENGLLGILDRELGELGSNLDTRAAPGREEVDNHKPVPGLLLKECREEARKHKREKKNICQMATPWHAHSGGWGGGGGMGLVVSSAVGCHGKGVGFWACVQGI